MWPGKSKPLEKGIGNAWAGRLRQADLFEFKGSLVYIASPRLARAA